MLCECVPVGTNVGGIPTAISDIGFLVPYGDADALADALQKALRSESNVGKEARTYIAERFTLEKREQSILRVIHELNSTTT
jgi:glycosyltransferase involved in cell wall biosynthesis